MTTGQPGMGTRRWPLRPIRFHPEIATCRGEAAPRPYLLMAYLHVINGLGRVILGIVEDNLDKPGGWAAGKTTASGRQAVPLRIYSNLNRVEAKL